MSPYKPLDHTLKLQGDVFHNGADILDNTANGFNPQSGRLRVPPGKTHSY